MYYHTHLVLDFCFAILNVYGIVYDLLLLNQIIFNEKDILKNCMIF